MRRGQVEIERDLGVRPEVLQHLLGRIHVEKDGQAGPAIVHAHSARRGAVRLHLAVARGDDDRETGLEELG